MATLVAFSFSTFKLGLLASFRVFPPPHEDRGILEFFRLVRLVAEVEGVGTENSLRFSRPSTDGEGDGSLELLDLS